MRRTIEESRQYLLDHPEEYRDVKDEDIDYSDIPPLTDEQLKQMRPFHRGRPRFAVFARKMISIKLDPQLTEKLKEEAKELGKGYQTLIHEILEAHVKKKAG